MKNMMKQLGIYGLALATVVGAASPSLAMPIGRSALVEQPLASDVVQVQFYGDRGYGGYGGYGGYRAPPPPREGGYGYGYRYREERPRNRHRDADILVPLGAFAAGAIIGGALNQQPREIYRPVPEYRPRPVPDYRPAPVYGARVGQAHVNWCANRYRSYDYRSNTFQPYNGPRQTCYSPYS